MNKHVAFQNLEAAAKSALRSAASDDSTNSAKPKVIGATPTVVIDNAGVGGSVNASVAPIHAKILDALATALDWHKFQGTASGRPRGFGPSFLEEAALNTRSTRQDDDDIFAGAGGLSSDSENDISQSSHNNTAEIEGQLVELVAPDSTLGKGTEELTKDNNAVLDTVRNDEQEDDTGQRLLEAVIARSRAQKLIERRQQHSFGEPEDAEYGECFPDTAWGHDDDETADSASLKRKRRRRPRNRDTDHKNVSN